MVRNRTLFALFVAYYISFSVHQVLADNSGGGGPRNGNVSLVAASGWKNSTAANSVSGDAVLLLAEGFLEKEGKSFGLTDALLETLPLQVDIDRFGGAHVRYEQYRHGVPVLGGQLVVHVNAKHQVTGMNGRVVPNISTNTVPSITVDTAIQKAKDHFSGGVGADANVGRTRLYLIEGGLLNDAATTSRLAWEIELEAEESASRRILYIDAHSGQLIREVDGTKGITRHVYDCSYMLLNGRYICALDFDSSRFGEYIYGRSEGQLPRGPSPTPAFVGRTDTDEAYVLAGTVHDYYLTQFGRNGANNQGGLGDGTNTPLNITRVETFWDAFGYAQDFAHYQQGKLIFAGGTLTPDVFAHEYAHGIDLHTYLDASGKAIGSVSYGERASLEENFCDVMGMGAEEFALGSTDWVLNGKTADVVFRSLADPPSIAPFTPSPYTGYPDRHYHPNFYCGTEDNGGQYNKANVPNKAAYLTAMGTANEPGGAFNGCTVTGIGLDKTLQIWYHAYTSYFTPAETFLGAYAALVTACSDLIQANICTASDCEQLQKALQAVEMDQPGKCSGIPAQPPSCSCTPTPELCDGQDNNCNGIIDDAPDSDSDGTNDCLDGCPSDPAKTSPGVCGCGTADVDPDSDGIMSCVDNCPSKPNADQRDSDNDTLGDACDTGKICSTLGGLGLQLDSDYFLFQGKAGERMVVTLTADPASSGSAKAANLTLALGTIVPNVSFSRSDFTTLANTIDAVLPANAPYRITIGERPRLPSSYTGRYCVELTGSPAAQLSLKAFSSVE